MLIDMMTDDIIDFWKKTYFSKEIGPGAPFYYDEVVTLPRTIVDSVRAYAASRQDSLPEPRHPY